MPNKVVSQLNQLVSNSFAASELNSATRPFVGVQIINLASQVVLLDGLIWGTIPAIADAPNLFGTLFVQRGLILDPSQAIIENQSEQIFQRPMYPASSLCGNHSFVEPVILASGYPYAVVLEYSALANVTNSLFAFLSVLGRQVPASGIPFPYMQR